LKVKFNKIDRQLFSCATEISLTPFHKTCNYITAIVVVKITCSTRNESFGNSNSRTTKSEPVSFMAYHCFNIDASSHVKEMGPADSLHISTWYADRANMMKGLVCLVFSNKR